MERMQRGEDMIGRTDHQQTRLIEEMRRRAKKREQVRTSQSSDIREVGLRGFKRESALSVETIASQRILEKLEELKEL